MGIDPPFIYDPPSRYSFSDRGFNPRAVTQASRSPPRSPRPKQNGPLVNFNRHPDSYIATPYGNLNAKPMNPRIKLKVKYTRWVQLFFRICSLLGALGILFCVICVKGTSTSVAWIIRIPPAVATLHTVYAIYHLLGSYKGRTPASASSYMIFAGMIDTGLIPFFVFTAYMSKLEYEYSSKNDDKWGTLFGNLDTTNKIIDSLFLISVVDGSLHLVSLTISIYLAIVYRQISKLPPDMNPLEDHLTSRHKRNKSSVADTKRMSQATTVSSDPSKRGSTAEDPLIARPRTIPFMHNRGESSTTVGSPSMRESPYRDSGSDRPNSFYPEQNDSYRYSQVDLNSRPDSRKAPSAANDGFVVAQIASPTSRPVTAMSTDSQPKTASRYKIRAAILDDCWFAHDRRLSSPSSPSSPSGYSQPSQDRRNNMNRGNSAVSSIAGHGTQRINEEYRPIHQTLSDDEDEDSPRNYSRPLSPLMVNPSTPPHPGRRNQSRGPLTPTGANRPGTGSRPGSIIGSPGKQKYYGDLGSPAGAEVGTYMDLPREDKSGRVISNSGVDLLKTGGTLGRRDVSGKVVEEGRGGPNSRWGKWRRSHAG
ncbi:MAG: hypothetical protein M1834_007407 [Cirrosporium novae-zelandiae]|nr:MAG: hypothetical protein M1834_007407 [Cirrosporium novae-zelandiae]